MKGVAVLLQLFTLFCACLIACAMLSADDEPGEETAPVNISGICPALAVFNRSPECGIGAVVPWADRLWFVTYSPHEPEGSMDKLYELTPDLIRITRPESIGGTPANRAIHTESNQLIIGPYFIDASGQVRVVDYGAMPGRPTAVMRHLTDPANKVYILGMEGEFYEVDVHTLQVRCLFERHPVAGSHAKGGYTTQGRVVIANNGEWGWYDRWSRDHSYDGPTGALAEWDGAEWNVVERKQFCEVTGPGGLLGSPDDSSPIWATGWDKRSVILKLLDGGQWRTFRLPKAGHTYDGGHGWHTEWPRIREVDGGKMLMTMHGMFYDFPRSFSAAESGGIRPLCTYLKMVVDFCDWDGRLVFACNHTSLFDNPLAGQAQSNLWLGTRDDLSGFGAPVGWGGVWVNDDVTADTPSDPYLFAGFDKRILHLSHKSDAEVTFTIEIDEQGDGSWIGLRSIAVPPHGYVWHVFPSSVSGEWVRIRADRDCHGATAFFHYGPDASDGPADPRFQALADIGDDAPRTTGVIRPRGADLGTLHFLAQRVDESGQAKLVGYYEVGPDMKLNAVDDTQAAEWPADKATVEEPDFAIDAASVIITGGDGSRYRLPKTDESYDEAWPEGWPRGIREVITERALLNCHGTFYELPRVSSGGLACLKPVCTHRKRIADFCTWRGLLVMAGNLASAEADGHYFPSDDGKTGLWFGCVDDLWKLGKPV